MIQKIVIVGATSCIAEHCARLWVAKLPKNMVLLGRDLAKTEHVANDLRVRSPQSKFEVHTLDFSDPTKIKIWVEDVFRLGVPDIVLIAHGVLPNQTICQEDLALNQSSLQINGVSPALFAEAFAGHMERANKGKLAIIGSVAGDRGRKSNYIYGSAKGLITRYAQGLQHRLAQTNVDVVLIKPGPTDTLMTADLKNNGMKLADVDDVARSIVKGIERGLPTVYAPMKWCLIMMIIRHLPRLIFNKMNI